MKIEWKDIIFFLMLISAALTVWAYGRSNDNSIRHLHETDCTQLQFLGSNQRFVLNELGHIDSNPVVRQEIEARLKILLDQLKQTCG